MITELLAKLTLEEKVSLVTGKDSWSTPAIPSIGLRSMMVSDGPSGVRGPVWDERYNSLSLPSATSIASTWDLAILRQVGRVMAHEPPATVNAPVLVESVPARLPTVTA